MSSIDILMITYDRASYVRRSLPHLLSTCDEHMRVWVWHNGTDVETLRAVEESLDHPRLHRFHHSRENLRLGVPTNWLWTEASGDYVSKVDDDCLVTEGWAQTLLAAHEANPELGVIGSWRFYDEDYVPELAERKLKTLAGGHRVLQNFWVQGSGYLLRRRCVDEHGLLPVDQPSFTRYCIRLALAGWINGWYFPFIHEEHLDDPRSPFTDLKSDADLQRHLPLSAAQRGVTTLSQWEAQMRRSARELQAASIDPRDYRGWRPHVRSVAHRVRASGHRLRRPFGRST